MSAPASDHPAAAPSGRGARTRRRIRAGTVGILALAVTAVTAWWTTQIARQIYAPATDGNELTCRPGVRELVVALEQARRSAAAETGGERAALEKFRAMLVPPWNARDRVSAACHEDPQALRLLEQLDLLRYAEEHAVRYEALELARRRRTVRALEAALFSDAVASEPSPH